jgi:hypothetical protein
MATTTFNDLITFSRGSNATVTGPNGLIQWAPANLLTNSQDFEATAWSKSGTATIVANSALSPDGTITGDKLVFNSGAAPGAAYVYRAVSGLTSGIRYTQSVFIKEAGVTTANIWSNISGSYTSVRINLSTGVLSQNGAQPLPASYSAISAGNGWWRVTISETASGTSGNVVYVDTSVTGDGTNGVFIWGAQLELGSTATTYNNTSVRNLLGFSEAFDDGGWSKTRCSIVTGAQANPVNGLFNAQKLMEDTINNNHWMRRSGPAGTYMFSVYAKAAGRSFIQLTGLIANTDFVTFNLATGTVDSAGSAVSNISITPVGDGWYRVAAYIPVNATGATIGLVSTAGAGWLPAYQGDGNSGVYIYGAMLSNSASLDPYVPTPGAAPSSTAYYGPRFDYDPVTLLPRGLLIEEQRVNSLTYSEQFDDASWVKVSATISANSATAPNGTMTADRVTLTGAGGRIQRAVTTTSSAVSLYVKYVSGTGLWSIDTNGAVAADTTIFNVQTGTIVSTGANNSGTTIVALANGWYRISTVRGATAGTTLYFGLSAGSSSGDEILIWGAQLEAGAFATSYIPTIASTVTRSADVATITGSLFSQWYNQSAGSFIVVADSPGVSGAANITTVDDGTLNERIRILTDVLDPKVIVTDGGVTQANIDAGAITALQPFNMSAAYALNDIAACLNGGSVGTDTSATLPTVTILRAGADSAGNYLNGHIRSIRYVPVRAADFQLQQVTT